MAQPLAGYQWNTAAGTGAGTTVLASRSATLVRIIVPGTYTGTMNIHDAVSVTGTTATSQIMSLGLPATSVAGHIEVGAECKNGIVIQSTGTPNVTIIYN